ncbi:hypothetical protein [Shinella kummerowiae]|uniref:hypothetical protein n=1 Tax=Shinella kummerowiae TaxID=417745 RepID=UPI0021B53CCE|nr:hypothetical protein [Shinella kummerowiae]MCT7663829.1 hypothetical protein [Shinella kummerowiae]
MNPAIVELTVEEMLADPIVQLVMKSDKIVADDIRQILREARQRRGAHSSSPGESELHQGAANPDPAASHGFP